MTINCTYVSDKMEMVVWYQNSRTGVRKPIVVKNETGNQVLEENEHCQCLINTVKLKKF